MNVSVKIKGRNRFLRAMSRAPGILEKEVDKALARAAGEVAVLAKIKAPKGANSHLTNNIIPGRSFSLIHYVKAGMNYAYDVEHGRGPGRGPGRETLIKWMKVKGIKPMNGSYRSAAFLIDRKLVRKGTKPQPFLNPALEEKRPRIVALVEAANKRALARISHV